MGEGPAESGRQPGSAGGQGRRGKGAGTHAGRGVRPVRVPGHARVCTRVLMSMAKTTLPAHIFTKSA